MKTKFYSSAAAIAVAALAVSACSPEATTPPAEAPIVEVAPVEEQVVETPVVEEPAVEVPTITSLAIATPELSTLATAVTAAGLAGTLDGAGPFTVLAPQNSAFEALPAGTLNTLLLPESKETLAALLTYHVVGTSVAAADLMQAISDNGGNYSISTVNGAMLTATIVDGVVVLTDTTGGTARVVDADIEAANGIVHVIDAVVLPN